MGFIKVSDVRKSFGKTSVLNGVDFEINKGDQVSLVGMSGSGKSTLLYLLGGLDKPSSGKIEIDGKLISTLADDDLARFRNQDVGFVFQFHYLLPSMNCLDNLLLPAKIGGADLTSVKKYVIELSEKLGVGHCLEKFPYEISGGEQQRVNIIRAVSLNPSLILCDEPTGNLDSKNSALVVALLREISERINATLILVTHDPTIASQLQRKITIEDGRIIG